MATSTVCWSFQDPDNVKNSEGSQVNLCYPSYVIKKGIAIAAYFTNGPADWASVAQQINDYVTPFFAKLAQCSHEFSLFAKPFSMAFQVIGIGELVNDMHYFINGDAYKDCKKFRYRIGSLFARILSVPTHWISASVFLNSINLAETIGNIRIFSWAAKAGAALQTLPGLSAIPKIVEAGQWLSEARIFKWIPALAAYGGIADGILCGVNALFFADGLLRYFHSKKRVEHYESDYRERLVKTINKQDFTSERIDRLLSEKKVKNVALLNFAEFNAIYRSNSINSSNQVELGRLRVKLLHQQNKQFQAKVDTVAAVAQLVLQVALVVGLASLGGLCVLGAFALLAVGTSLYYKYTLKKPDLDSVLL